MREKATILSKELSNKTADPCFWNFYGLWDYNKIILNLIFNNADVNIQNEITSSQTTLVFKQKRRAQHNNNVSLIPKFGNDNARHR